MQIDVKEVISSRNMVSCNLYTGERCVRIFMTESDYLLLIKDGFFIRDGKEPDSANVLNTTRTYSLAAEKFFL